MLEHLKHPPWIYDPQGRCLCAFSIDVESDILHDPNLLASISVSLPRKLRRKFSRNTNYATNLARQLVRMRSSATLFLHDHESKILQVSYNTVLHGKSTKIFNVDISFQACIPQQTLKIRSSALAHRSP